MSGFYKTASCKLKACLFRVCWYTDIPGIPGISFIPITTVLKSAIKDINQKLPGISEPNLEYPVKIIPDKNIDPDNTHELEEFPAATVNRV